MKHFRRPRLKDLRELQRSKLSKRIKFPKEKVGGAIGRGSEGDSRAIAKRGDYYLVRLARRLRRPFGVAVSVSGD